MFLNEIARKLRIKPAQVEIVLQLRAQGSTVPFIARYRKDVTGALDEVQIQQIEDEHALLTAFEERKLFIVKTIGAQGQLTDALQHALDAATSIAQLEDLYLPYKQKRKTRASIARENGLEPLADLLLHAQHIHAQQEAEKFINEKVLTPDDALQGARDIIAEIVNEDVQVRASLRNLFSKEATLQSIVHEDMRAAAAKYQDYFAYTERIATIPSHRVLAVLRGFLEGMLSLNIAPPEIQAIAKIEALYINQNNEGTPHVQKAIKDGYKRLLQPALETECRTALKAAADEEAIKVFSENLRQLLLSAPLGSKKVLAIDPGYRTGCKVVCINELGELQETAIVFIHEKNRLTEAISIILHLVKKYNFEAFAVGDGTAGRETEQFIKGLQTNIPVHMVNEDGASVYSASETARQEFPNEDITVRGAVSIGRRLMDPLAELVKIDPKSIGVGQYQHDVNQPKLKERLDQTVMSCVNSVGVNVNTASKNLLAYVSGIGAVTAENIVQYRKLNGQFTKRTQLLKVPRLGEKAFEQCAGFLRIASAENPLDASGVHPEAYHVVEQMAADHNLSVKALIGNEDVLKHIDAKHYSNAVIGLHSIKDIIKELKKPGLDPRAAVKQFEFAAIFSITDVQVGMEVPGVVTNITRFGAFVDIGVKQDGLVHVSEIAHTYISDPATVLKLNQQVKVKVTEVDVTRKRIALSIKQALPAPVVISKSKVSNRLPQTTPSTMQKAAEVSDLGAALAQLKQKFKN